MEYSDYLGASHVHILPYIAAFAAVVETGSFVDASHRLGITASAVSKQVSKLEKALSVRLLERSTRQLRVNAEGTEVYSHCRKLLESSTSICRLKGLSQNLPRGLIKIAVPRVFYQVCDQLFPSFLKKYPAVSVQLICDDVSLDFISDDIDIGIRITDAPPLGMIARELFEVDYAVCASPSYLQSHGTPLHPTQLVNHSCIPIGFGDIAEEWSFVYGSEVCNIRVTGRYHSDSPNGATSAALSNLGLGCFTIGKAEELSRQGLVSRILPAWKYCGSLQGTAWLMYLPGKYRSTRIGVLVEYLLEELRAVGKI